MRYYIKKTGIVETHGKGGFRILKYFFITRLVRRPIHCIRWMAQTSFYYYFETIMSQNIIQLQSNVVQLSICAGKFVASTWLKQNRKLKVSAIDCAPTKSWKFSLYGHIEDLASVDQVANRFIKISNISATWSYAQLICRTFIKKLWAFFGPYRSLWVTAILKKKRIFSSVKQIQQSTAHTFTGWARSRLAVLQLEMYGCVYTYFIETDIYML